MSDIEERCAICDEVSSPVEIIQFNNLKENPDIEYMTRSALCLVCGTNYACASHMHLNKLEMLIARKKEKALLKQSLET